MVAPKRGQPGSEIVNVLGRKTLLIVRSSGCSSQPHLFWKSSRSKAQIMPPPKPIFLMYSLCREKFQVSQKLAKSKIYFYIISQAKRKLESKRFSIKIWEQFSRQIVFLILSTMYPIHYAISFAYRMLYIKNGKPSQMFINSHNLGIFIFKIVILI